MAKLHINAELLLGSMVSDADGRKVGRIEEFKCGKYEGFDAVLEYHLGAGAALERILAFVRELPFFDGLPARRIRRVRWDQMDLSDPTHPRLLVRREELKTEARGEVD